MACLGYRWGQISSRNTKIDRANRKYIYIFKYFLADPKPILIFSSDQLMLNTSESNWVKIFSFLLEKPFFVMAYLHVQRINGVTWTFVEAGKWPIFFLQKRILVVLISHEVEIHGLIQIVGAWIFIKLRYIYARWLFRLL